MTDLEFLKLFAERQIKCYEDLLEALKLEEQARKQEKTVSANHGQYTNASAPLQPDNIQEQERVKELDALLWKDFANGNGSWVKTELIPSWLLSILQTTKKSFTFAMFDYKLSGDKQQFVNRFHTKDGKP